MDASSVHLLLFRAAVLLAAGVSGAFLVRKLPKQEQPPFLNWLLFVLPFASGTFYTYLAPVVSAALLGWLFARTRKRALLLRWNLTTLALCALAGFYLLTPLWAADKGMAVLGAVRFLPIVLYALALLQLSPDERTGILRLVPLSGVLMTVLCGALQFIPALQGFVTVNGRLSGCFEYPNTYALFLLAGFVLLTAKKEQRLRDWIFAALLVLGLLASGSRTAFVLLLVAAAVLCVAMRRLRYCLGVFAVVGGCIALSLLLSYLDLLPESSRYLTISAKSGTFLARLLYYKDALALIIKRPFGLGYWGYRAVLGSVQTGRYYISYVHNGLLQLLLDVGWVPSLLLTAALCKALFGKKTALSARLMLGVLCAHALLDFDLQFLVIWFLLLPLLDFQSGKETAVRRAKPVYGALSLAALALSLWVGAGDFLYQTGNARACAQLAPFYTEAQITLLQQTTEVEQSRSLAMSITAKNETSALAWSALGNAAFSTGDMQQMMVYKERALECDRYALDSYSDYVRLLSTARTLYLQAGDAQSAEVCRQKLLSVPQTMALVTAQTSALAVQTGEDSSLLLPPDCQALIDEVR